jgi:hypothetical protein
MTTAIIILVVIVAGIWGIARILKNWYAKDIAENKTKRFSEWLAFRIARWRRKQPEPIPNNPVDPTKPVEPIKPSKPIWTRRLLRWDVQCPCGAMFSCRRAVNSTVCPECGSVITRDDVV